MRADAAPSTQALRGWQRRALVRYLAAKPRDFLAVATPGSGKTTFALRIAAELLAERTVDQVTVVVPTEHLKVQWAAAAARAGIALDPKFSNSNAQTSSSTTAWSSPTPRWPATRPVTGCAPRTAGRWSIFDEIHHGGDAKTLGRGHPRGLRRCHPPPGADRHAVPQRRQRHPVRHLRAAVPTVSSASQADHTYGYAEALADGVVRPVVFLAYSGEARWRDSAGEEHAARLGEPLNAEQTARAWRTALNPAGEWMPAVIAAADTRLRQLREHVPDAGGMIIASDQTTARAYADLLTTHHRRGAHGRAVRRPWLLGPHHGVLRQRRAVGWWRCAWSPRASTSPGWPSVCTPPARRRRCSSRRRSAGSCGPGAPGETASIFLPSVPNLLQLASELEEQRNHVLGKPHRESQDDPLDAELRRAAQGRTRRTGQRFRDHWAPTPNWIRSSSTARRSAPPPRPAATRRPITSASRACWMPARCATC